MVNNFGAKFLEKLKEGETTGRNSPKISASLMQNRKALPLISRISGNTEKEPFRLLCLKEKWKESEFHNIIFNPNTTFEIFYDHLIEVYQSLLKGINILNIPSLEEIANKSFELNNRSKKTVKIIIIICS